MTRNGWLLSALVLVCGVANAEDRQPLTIRGPQGWVAAVVFTPDGRSLVSASADNTAALWDASVGRKQAEFRGHDDYVTAVAVTSDGKTLATGSFDKTARLWDVARAEQRLTLRGHTGAVLSVAFSPDDKTLATGSVDGTIQLWDVATGANRASFRGHKTWVNGLAFAADGRTLASGSSDATVRLWDVPKRQTLAVWPSDSSEVRCVAFSGKQVAAGTRYGVVRVWDAASQALLKAIPGKGKDVWSVAFTPDGRTLVIAEGDWKGPSEIRSWDTDTWRQRETIQHSGEVLSLAISRDGTRLAAGSWDKSITIWPLRQPAGAGRSAPRPKTAKEEVETLLNRLRLRPAPATSGLAFGYYPIFGDSTERFIWNHRYAIHSWEAARLAQLDQETEVAGLLLRAAEVEPIVVRALAQVPVDQPAAEALTFLLGRLGTKTAVPILIEQLRRLQKPVRNQPEPWIALANRGFTTAATVWALWELTGRPFEDADAWQRWWQVVQSDFVPVHDRRLRKIEEPKVQALVRRLGQEEFTARELLIGLGPNALPYLLRSLADAAQPERFRRAWVIDEIGAAPRIPPAVAADYFAQRLAHEDLETIMGDRLCRRAFTDQPFVGFCRTAIAFERAYAGKDQLRMAGRVKVDLPRRGPFYEQPLTEVPPAVPVIVMALDDPNRNVRNVAVQLADLIGLHTALQPPNLVTALGRHWKSESDDWLRYETAIAFGRFDTPQLRQGIRDGLWSPNDGIVGDSAALLDDRRLFDREHNPEIFVRLVQLAGHTNTRLRRISVRTLRERGPDLLAPQLGRLVKDDESSIRVECAIIMRTLKDPHHTRFLLTLLKDKDEVVRDWTFGALGDPAFRAAIPQLQPLLKDKKHHLQAMWAIVGMGGPDAVAVLMAELQAENTLGDSLFQALEKLTGKKLRTRAEWLKWWGVHQSRS
jgi:HEAT repeat protein